MVPELLAPAGSPEALRCALASGADAVYCGLAQLNARRGAANFSEAELAEGCRLAHLVGARVYLTLNICVRDDELAEALATAERAVECGVDALIVADLGLLELVHRAHPEVELHVSTQANVHDPAGIAWCASHGATRVTLSRELTLAEIGRCCEAGRAVGVACEVFCHGAICISYSGLCAMSALRGDRSAQRGLCAQPCRLPHGILERTDDGSLVSLTDGECRALCPKDLSLTRELGGLMEAGVAALKIEGRMKAPDYVLAVTAAWRDLIDHWGEPGVVGRAEDALGRAFNREFTSDYLRGRAGGAMMSPERSNNRGALVGEVASASGRRAVVALSEPVGEGDLLELRPLADPQAFLCVPSPRDAGAGEALELALKRAMPEGTPVRALRRAASLEEAKAAAKRPHPRRRAVAAQVRVRLGEPLEVTLTALPTLSCPESVSATALGPVVEVARTKELTEADVVAHVARMGDSPFAPIEVGVELDGGVGMAFSAIHRTRADAVASLERALLAPAETRARRVEAEVRELPASATALLAMPRAKEPPAIATGPVEPEVVALVEAPEQAEAALGAGADATYVAMDALERHGREAYPIAIAVDLPELGRDCDRVAIGRSVRSGFPVVAGSLAALGLAREESARFEVGATIPIYNRATARVLIEEGARALWLCPELSLAEIAGIARAAGDAGIPVGLMVRGPLRAMTCEHCVTSILDGCTGHCAGCELRERDLVLANIDGRHLPVRTDAHGRSRIYWDETLDLVPRVAALREAGVTRLLVDGRLMAPEVLRAEVARLRDALDGRVPAPRARTTLAHLLHPVA